MSCAENLSALQFFFVSSVTACCHCFKYTWASRREPHRRTYSTTSSSSSSQSAPHFSIDCKVCGHSFASCITCIKGTAYVRRRCWACGAMGYGDRLRECHSFCKPYGPEDLHEKEYFVYGDYQSGGDTFDGVILKGAPDLRAFAEWKAEEAACGTMDEALCEKWRIMWQRLAGGLE